MKSFAEKVRDARCELGLSQAKLAAQVGISDRMIKAYEGGEKRPRQSTMLKLARELKVSVRFLRDDSCDDPLAEIEKDGYIEAARDRYGTQGTRDANMLLADNVALFAGGELTQEQKDLFFEAVMKAYFACREESRRKFGKKGNE